MTVLKAREYKMQMSVADYPHNKDDARRRKVEAMDRHIADCMPKKIMSMDELMKELANG